MKSSDFIWFQSRVLHLALACNVHVLVGLLLKVCLGCSHPLPATGFSRIKVLRRSKKVASLGQQWSILCQLSALEWKCVLV